MVTAGLVRVSTMVMQHCGFMTCGFHKVKEIPQDSVITHILSFGRREGKEKVPTPFKEDFGSCIFTPTHPGGGT